MPTFKNIEDRIADLDKLPPHLKRAWRLVLSISSFSHYSIDSSDDQLDDAIATLNSLRAEAQSIRDSQP